MEKGDLTMDFAIRRIPLIAITALLAVALAPAAALAVEPDVAPDVSDPNADVPTSWRYQEGEPVPVEGDEAPIMTLSNDARALAPWSKGPDGYVNSRGEVIPNATRKGVDVSEWQGLINWEKVKADGIDFAILRVGYRRSLPMVDKQWLRNVAECERLGIPYGVYIYSYGKTVADATAEADHIIAQLQKGGHKPVYPVYFDLEESSMASTSNRALLGQMAKAFCEKVEAAGYRAGTYANLYWYNTFLTDPVFDRWTRWVAQYNYRCDYKKPYDLWQCTSQGSVDGIVGNVDLDFQIGANIGKPLGWHQEGGTWYWYQQNGEPFKGAADKPAWLYISGRWYLFDKDGKMLTGWQDVEGQRYYLNGSGAMEIGWLNLGGTWYYLSSSGAMAKGWQTIGGSRYYLGDDGKMRVGWADVDKDRYYFTSSGAAHSGGWLSQGGTWYWLESGGKMAKGWKAVGGTWYYLGDDGKMRTGWAQVDKTWYYLEASGAMRANGWLSVNGSWYWLEPSGAVVENAWRLVGGTWYYLKAGGYMATGWVLVDKTWYWCDASGAMRANGWLNLGGTWYYLSGSGAMLTGWINLGGTWYYLSSSGAMVANAWVGDYYLTGSGAMAVSTQIGPWRVGADGRWIR